MHVALDGNGTGSISGIKVRYAETDQMGFVHHSNHIIWFEIARMKLFQDNGIDIKKIEEEGLLLPVLSVEAKYISPAFYGDELNINAYFMSSTNVRIKIQYEIVNDSGKKICSGNSEHAFISRNSRNLILVPDWINKKIVRINKEN
ncbi:MAG: acyl-CoA thioesterase [Spirochaetes bacterium]|nr:acyl-CoA thioesterase [Spirochaetota bacterium]